jgi:iron complex outermembrane receptor protein
LEIRNEGGTFGATRVATEIPGSTGLTADGQFFANGRYVQESYSILNFSTGVNKDNWGVELFVNNVLDEDGIVNINTQDYTPRVSVTRPRTVGLRFRWNYQ